MNIIDEIIQNLNIIIGLTLQCVGIAIYNRLSSIMHLSVKIGNKVPDNPSRTERAALYLAQNADERIRFLKRYIAIHLLVDIVTVLIGPWYIFLTFIPVISIIQLSFLMGMRKRGYFNY